MIAGLTGRRVLVVEDEPLIAMLLEDMLTDLGAEIAGVADTVSGALERLESDGVVDIAVLDMSLRGRTVEPVADALADRGVPFVFASGYGADVAVGRHAAAPVLPKPFARDALEAALLRCLGD